MLRAAAVASAAIAIALAAALASEPGLAGTAPLLPLPQHPAAAPTEGRPAAPDAPQPHRGLLPAAYADHVGALACDSGIVTLYMNGLGTVSLHSVEFVSPDGVYGPGDRIVIRVNATTSENEGIGGTSSLQSGWIPHTSIVLNASDAGRHATFATPGTTLTTLYSVLYAYTVQEGDYSDDLDYKSTTSLYWRHPNTMDNQYHLVQTGGGKTYNCLLPAPGSAGSLSYQSDVRVDGIAPRVSGVAANVPDGAYGEGREVSIRADFDETVAFNGTVAPPSLTLDFGGTNRVAAYASGNNTGALVFNYTLQDGDDTARLDYNATNALSAAGLEDAAGNAANLTLPAPGAEGSLWSSSRIATDTVPPEAVSVTSPDGGGEYGIGDTIRVNVTFTEAVTVDDAGGTPAIELETGAIDRNAAYASGSGESSLLFEYAVQPGDVSAGLAYTGADLSLNGGTIRDGAGNAANLALPPPGAGLLAPGIMVDGVAPRIANVTSPDADGTYGTGATINITVGFTEPVAFDSPGAPPEIPLDTGSGSAVQRSAICIPGGTAASTELACAYEVREGDETSDLGYATGSSLVLGGGGTAADEAGNGLELGLPDSTADSLEGTKSIALDTAVPEVLHVMSPNASAEYGRGATIRVDVVFDGPVEIDPAPLEGDPSVPVLRLETGENDRAARYAGGSGTDTLGFDYTVIAGDFSADLNYTGTDALSLEGRALVDEYGNRDGGAPALPDPASADSLGGQEGIEIRTVPTVESVGANYSSGTSLKVGQTVGVRVEFSEKVRVAAADNGSLPHIGLDTGRAEQGRAGYSSGDGGRVLVFAYPVHPDDSKAVLDYAGAGALEDNGARIYGAGADANLTLPKAGSNASLAAAKIKLLPNEAPSIDAPGNRTQSAGVELRVGITAADPEGQPIAFSLIEPVPDGASIEATSPEAALLTWTPTEAQRTARGAANATYVITVRASDPHAGSDTVRFAVTVIERPPAGYTGPTIADIPDMSGREGEEIRFEIAVAAGGHGPFAYSLVVEADPRPPRGATVHPNGTFHWVPGYDQSGTHQITARAADRFGLEGNRSFSVTVLDAEPPGNAPPAIEPIGPQSVGEGERLVVRVSAADPDLPIAYSLAGDPPARSSIDGATGVFTWNVWYDQAGTHNITVSAADRYGSASLASFTVEVADVVPPALPPLIDPIPAQSATAGALLSLQVNASDPNEGDSVAFGLAGAPPQGAAITADGLFTWVPGRGQVGQHTLNVTAADGGGLAAWAPLVVAVSDPTASASASASAVFAGPRTVRIDYTAPLGPPAGHAGPVYGAVSIEGGGSAEPAAVSGLGTRTHTVQLDGDEAGRDRNGTIALLAGLEGAANGILHSFAGGDIPVRPGEEARTLSPPGAPPAPVAAVERDGFVRAINATAAGDAARPAVNVSGLAGGPGAQGADTATMPGEPVSIITSFAVVTIPPNAAASPVPAGGLIEVYVSERPPTARDVADALGRESADGIEVLTVAEIGDSAARIEFSLPVRVLLVGQANGSAFYVDAAGGAVPIRDTCNSDDFGLVHAQLGGSGECWRNSGPDKVIYTYHLTGFGTATVPAGMCGATLARQDIDFANVGAGSESGPVPQEVRGAYGSLPLREVSIRAEGDWMRTGGGGGPAMPASATQVRAGGAAVGDAWAPLDGEFVAVPGSGGWSAHVEFRVAVPADALRGAASGAVPVSQTVSYTVECESPAE